MRICCLKIITAIFLLILSHKALSQTAATAVTTIGVNEAINLYHRFLQPETGLYNGTEYIDYAYLINEGSPYFMSAQLTAGSVVYHNILYLDVPMQYDIVKGEVVISDQLHQHKISLQSEQVSGFTILGNSFVRLTKDSSAQSFINTGFYQVLYKGRSRLLKKQTKTVQENLSVISGLEQYLNESQNFYLEKNHTYYVVNNKTSLLDAMRDKKKEMQHFIKKNKLRFKKNKDAALLSAVQHYDEL